MHSKYRYTHLKQLEVGHMKASPVAYSNVGRVQRDVPAIVVVRWAYIKNISRVSQM